MSQALETVGSLLSLPAILTVVGVTVFGLSVFRGSTGEIRLLVRMSVVASLVTVVGAILETYGLFGILGVGWSDVTSDERLWAPLMRWFSGGLLAVGYVLELGREADLGEEVVRWNPGFGGAIALVGAMIGLFSFAFDGHTVSQGPRIGHAVLNVVHVGAGSVWLGGLVALVALRLWRRAQDASLAPMVVRFSTVATVALVVVGAAGLAMSWVIVDGASDYVGTPWGLTLLLKVGIVIVAAGIGAFNHFVVVPVLEENPDDRVAANRARRTIVAEFALLLGAAIVTVFLTGASIN